MSLRKQIKVWLGRVRRFRYARGIFDQYNLNNAHWETYPNGNAVYINAVGQTVVSLLSSVDIEKAKNFGTLIEF